MGEKFHTKQILFNLDPRKSDLKQTIEKLKTIQKELFFDPGAFDSTAVNYYNKYNNFSGNYISVDYEKIPSTLTQKLLLMPEYSYSDVFVIDNNVYLLYKYKETLGGGVVLEKDWALIENRALENKKTSLFKDWLKQKKETMYIKINSF